MGIVAENAARIIREQGLDKGTVAREAGIAPQAFEKMLSGKKRILAGHVAPLSKALGSTPNELYGFSRGGIET